VSDRYHETLDRVEAGHWWFVALRALVVEHLLGTAPPPARVLDAGCSTGHLLGAVPAAYERTGIDVSEGALELARRRRPEVEFVLASVEDLPFEPGSFEAVLATDSLSAVGVDDDRLALSEIRRVLSPGGVLIAQVAAYEWLRSGHDEVAGTARRYTAPGLRRLLAESGFRVEHLTYRVTLLFPLAVAHRLLSRRATESDVSEAPAAVNAAFRRAMSAENRLARRWRLPFGLSVLAVARAE